MAVALIIFGSSQPQLLISGPRSDHSLPLSTTTDLVTGLDMTDVTLSVNCTNLMLNVLIELLSIVELVVVLMS